MTVLKPFHTQRTPLLPLVLLALALIFSLLTAEAASAQPHNDKVAPLAVKYFNRGNSEGLRAYQLDLIQLILRKTEPTHGAYSLEIVDMTLSSPRAKAETEKGEIINVHYSTEWLGEYVNESQVHRIEHPVLKGLLGMRSLIIPKDRLSEFNNIKHFAQLTAHTAGQSSDWPDIDILEFNQLKVITSESIEPLPRMLQAGRFTYLPLSILEAPATAYTYSHTARPLTISPDVAIYYPLEMNLFVNKQTPGLTERFKAGFDKIKKDGSMDKLFDQHFGDIVDALPSSKLKTFVLANPSYSHEQNQQYIKQYAQEYKQGDNLIYPNTAASFLDTASPNTQNENSQ